MVMLHLTKTCNFTFFRNQNQFTINASLSILALSNHRHTSLSMGRCIILGQPPSSHNSVRKSIKKITWPQTACASALACLDNMMSLRIDVFNKCILRNVQGPCIFHFLYPKGRYKATKSSKIFPTLRAAKIQGHSILRHLILGHLTLLHLVLGYLNLGHLILRPNYDLRKL